MTIISSDGRYSIPMGGVAVWDTLCATIRVRLKDSKKELSHVFAFIEKEKCKNKDCMETAKEFNLVRDALSRLDPSQIVYDEKDPSKLPPWGNDISPVITSCGNYLTTGDGNDLLAEIVKILVIAAYTKADVEIT